MQQIFVARLLMNKDIKLRDQIIFNGYDKKQYMGGIRHIPRISINILNSLIKLHFIDLNECQNNSPTTEEIFEFMQKYPKYYAHGYAVDISRDDYRITLEGVEKDSPFDSDIEAQDFEKLFGEADEIETNDTIYCWFD